MTMANFAYRRPVNLLIWTVTIFIILEPCSIALAQNRRDHGINLKEPRVKSDYHFSGNTAKVWLALNNGLPLNQFSLANAEHFDKVKNIVDWKGELGLQGQDQGGGFDKKWLWIGGAVVVVGVLVAVLAGGKTEETPQANPLPGPPPLP